MPSCSSECSQTELPTDQPYQGSSRRSSDGSSPSTGKPGSDLRGSVGHRRRQWGSHSGDRLGSAVPTVSSDTLEKLVPTLNTGVERKSKSRSSSSISSGKRPSNTQSALAVREDSGVTKKRSEPDKVSRKALTVESSKSTNKSGPMNGDGNSISHDGQNSSVTAQKGAESTSINTGEALQNKPLGKRKGPKETKAVGYLIEAPERIEPFAPAKHRPTNIIYIRSLVRPFTADQLRQMISERFGAVSDLWLDRIKSSSLVRMESVEVATRCREGLDGCRWPSMNPHTLHCDFGNDELFKWMCEHGNSGENVPPKHLVLGENPPEVTELESTSMRTAGARKKHDVDPKEPPVPKSSDRRPSKSERVNESSQPVPKEAVTADASDPKRRYEEPAKLLDDLFRKTASTPCIYWLPLPEEQARKQATERARLLRTNPPTTTRPLSRPFTHGPSGPKQRATRSPFTSPVEQDKTTSVPARTSGSRSDEPKTRPTQGSDLKDKGSTVTRKELSPVSVSHVRRRSRSTDLRRKRERVSLTPPRVAPSSRPEPRLRERRHTPSNRPVRQAIARKRDQTSPSPPRPRVVRRSTSTRSRSRRSSSSASSRSSRGPRSRGLGDTRRGKAAHRGFGRPRSRSAGRKHSPARVRR
ncbi:Apoptotic chromatin condensation inducer in the nucleus [Fasciola gigantica]|uniref:Apoptotic chromatin condensation inducer in the nucleus n=1 Tax=Fasciola gigantica TaxID=46835 RepID=A0A504YR82_FASGI|nr:Apoptotic chromatin condensation inducer in the nucleus [Fasciola gigantica]